MTWEPTNAEIDAYNAAATEAAARADVSGIHPVNRRRGIAKAGLQAAYAALENRLFGGDPTVLGPPMQIGHITPPLMEYREVGYIGEVNQHAYAGWRLHTVAFVSAPEGETGWSYVLERERPAGEQS